MLLKVPFRIHGCPSGCPAWKIITSPVLFKSLPRISHQCAVIRFFHECFESSTFAGTHPHVGDLWYKEHEINTRSATFTSSGLIGIIFSGFMQGAIYTSMDRKRGLAGWRWLFIIDFLITLPICFYGLLCFPGSPDNMKASFFFSEEELIMAKARLPPRKRDQIRFIGIQKSDWEMALVAIFSIVGFWRGKRNFLSQQILFLLFG